MQRLLENLYAYREETISDYILEGIAMKRVEYVVCPVCGRNRVLETKEKGRVGWPNGVPLDLESTFLLQIREGGGKKAGEGGHGYRGSAPGSGFHLVDGLTLPQMIESGNYEEILEGLKQQLLRVVKQSIDVGFIERDEI